MKVSVSFELDDEQTLRNLIDDLTEALPPGTKAKIKFASETTIIKSRRPASTPLDELLAANKIVGQAAKTA